MPTLKLTNEQLETLQTGWELITEGDDSADEIATKIGLEPADRGLEDEEGNELEDYDEGEDPVHRRIGEIALLLEQAKPD